MLRQRGFRVNTGRRGTWPPALALARLADSFRFFYAAFPRQMRWTLCSFTVTSLLNAVAIVNLAPLVMLVLGDLDVDYPIGRSLANAYRQIGLEPTIASVLLVIGVLVAVRALLQLAAMTQIGFASARMGAELRIRLLRGVTFSP